MIEAGPSRQTTAGANKGLGGASSAPKPKKKNIFQKIGSALSPKSIGNVLSPKTFGSALSPKSLSPKGIGNTLKKGLDVMPGLPGMPGPMGKLPGLGGFGNQMNMPGMPGPMGKLPGLGGFQAPQSGGIMGPGGPVTPPPAPPMMQNAGPLAQHYMQRPPTPQLGQMNAPVYMNNQGGNQGAFRQLGIPLSPPTSENSRGFGGQMGVGGNMNQYAGQGKPIWMT